MARAADVQLSHVPYKGAPPAMQDLLAGQVAANLSVFSNALPHVLAGKLRALAPTSERRIDIASTRNRAQRRQRLIDKHRYVLIQWLKR